MKLQRLIICVAILSAMYISHAVELRIYGGSDHSTFLGVLNGSKFESDSIWNNYGTYGSKYNSESIWTKYG